MRGKKAARAAPMLALAAISCCSAGTDVGPALQQVGRQAGGTLGSGGRRRWSRRPAGLGQQLGRHVAPTQQRERVAVLRAPARS